MHSWSLTSYLSISCLQCSVVPSRYIVLKNIITIQISKTIEVPVNHCFQGAKGVMYSFPQDWGQKMCKE